MVANNTFERRVGAVVAIRRCQLDIAQHWCAETIGIFQSVAFAHAADIPHHWIETPRPAGSERGQANCMKLLVTHEFAGMAAGAIALSVKETHAALLRIGQCGLPAGKILVERTVETRPFDRLEGCKCISDFGNRDLPRLIDVIERIDKHLAVFGNDANPLGKDWPGGVYPVVNGACDLVFFRVAGHFELGNKRKNRLGRKKAVQALGKPFLRRRVEAVFIVVGNGKTAVVEKRVKLFCPEIPEAWRISRNPFLNPVVVDKGGPVRSEAFSAFANAEGKAVSCSKDRMMTCRTGNIPVPGKDPVVKEKLTEGRLFPVEGDEIIVSQRGGKLRGMSWCCQKNTKKERSEKMTKMLKAAVIGLFLAAGPAQAEIENARDLMEAGQFEEARKELWPAARSGNADAEELIGVMYAMGLGVERDDQRAFEWYLRSAMKGHPGAQSGIGWYYEVGRGMPAPDLVRAYMWYTLSAIGGDPDAAISLEEVVKKMTKEEIEKAHILVDDYKVWMYPFR